MAPCLLCPMHSRMNPGTSEEQTLKTPVRSLRFPAMQGMDMDPFVLQGLDVPEGIKMVRIIGWWAH